MKRLILIAAVLLLLCGCTPKLAANEENGSPWNDDWQIIGTDMGVADPGNGLALYEYNDVQGIDGTYYASWSCGEATEILNDAGKAAKLFPAQLYLLTNECVEQTEAQNAVAQWLAIGETGYTVEKTAEHGDFTIYRLTPKNESPFTGGWLALGIHNRTAISVELMVSEPVYEDEQAVMETFLDGLHYRAEEE